MNNKLYIFFILATSVGAPMRHRCDPMFASAHSSSNSGRLTPLFCMQHRLHRPDTPQGHTGAHLAVPSRHTMQWLIKEKAKHE